MQIILTVAILSTDYIELLKLCDEEFHLAEKQTTFITYIIQFFSTETDQYTE